MNAMRLLTVFFLLGLAARAHAQDLKDDAILTLAMPDRQFASFLASTTMRTQTFKIALGSLGIDAGAKAYCPALVDALEKHLPTWRANLLSIYREHIPQATLKDAVERGSLDGSRLLAPYMNAVGKDMQEKSLPILKEAAAEVLTTFFGAASKTKASDEEKAAHLKELAEFNPRGFCARYAVPGISAGSR